MPRSHKASAGSVIAKVAITPLPLSLFCVLSAPAGSLLASMTNIIVISLARVYKDSQCWATTGGSTEEVTFEPRNIAILSVSQALAFCRTAGYRSVLLWTLRGLHAATHLYQSVGFRLTETHSARLWGQTLTEERYDLNLDTPQP